MKNTYKLIWSNEALVSLKSIIAYLEEHWTKKEIKRFARLLDKQLHLIEQNPFTFPRSDKWEEFRKSVLTKQITIYYKIVGYEVRIISVFDNRQNPEKINNP